MAHEIFISYPSKNKDIADAICAFLEIRKFRCWIAPRDILPGQNFAEALYDAIDTSSIFVLVFSEITNNSPHIMSEIQRAFNKNIVIIPFRVEAVEPSKALQYYIGTAHWLDALTPPLEEQLLKLCTVVRIFLEKSKGSWEDEIRTISSASAKGQSPPLQPGKSARVQEDNSVPTPPRVPPATLPSGAACPSCSTYNRDGAIFCKKCGWNLSQTETPPVQIVSSSPLQGCICPSCGRVNKPGAGFCGRCGTTLSLANQTGNAAPAESQNRSVPVCPICQNPVKPGSRFCARCGRQLG